MTTCIRKEYLIQKYKQEYIKKGYTAAISEPITLHPKNAVVAEGDTLTLKNGYDGVDTPVLFWENQS